MAWELREGQGSLFRNEKKEKDNHPDHKGELMINGQAYWVSAWIKEGARGRFFSLAVKPKEAKPAGTVADMDDSIPF